MQLDDDHHEFYIEQQGIFMRRIRLKILLLLRRADEKFDYYSELR